MATQPQPVTARHVAKGVGTTMVARLASVIDVVAQPAYVAMFGLASFGLYTALWSAVNIAENIVDLGMTSAMQRTVPKSPHPQDEAGALAAAMLAGVGPCILIAAAASLFAPALAPVFNAAASDQARLVPAIRLFAWALPLWTFVEIATSALRAKRLFGPEIRIRLLWEQIARLMLAGCFWLAGWGISGLFLAHLMSLSLSCLLSVRLLAVHFDLTLLRNVRPRDAMVRETLLSGLAILPTNIVAQLFTDGPPLLLNIMLPGAAGATASALFGIARKVASVVQLLRTAFAYVLAPLAAAATRVSVAQVEELYGYATRLTAAAVLPLGLVLAADALPILSVFKGHAQVAAMPLVLLIAARMLEAISGPSKPVQQVVSGFAQQLPASLTGLAAAVAIGMFAVPRYGLTGMAAAVAIGIVLAGAIPVEQLWRNDRLHPFRPPFARVMLAGGAVSLLGAGIALAIQAIAPDWLALLLLIPVALATIWASARLGLTLDDRLTLGSAARRLRLVPTTRSGSTDVPA